MHIGEAIRKKEKKFPPDPLQKEKETNPIGYSLLPIVEVDYCLEEISPLMEPSYRGWFAAQVYRLGPTKVLQLATRARTGHTPKGLFVKLLKEA